MEVERRRPLGDQLVALLTPVPSAAEELRPDELDRVIVDLSRLVEDWFGQVGFELRDVDGDLWFSPLPERTL